MRRRLLLLLPALLAAVVAAVFVGRSRRRRTGLPPSWVVERSAPDAFGAAVTETAEHGGR